MPCVVLVFLRATAVGREIYFDRLRASEHTLSPVFCALVVNRAAHDVVVIGERFYALRHVMLVTAFSLLAYPTGVYTGVFPSRFQIDVVSKDVRRKDEAHADQNGGDSS